MMPVSKRSNYFYRLRGTPARFCGSSFPVFSLSTFDPQKMAGYPHIAADVHRFMHSSSTGSVDNSGNAVPPFAAVRAPAWRPDSISPPALRGCRIHRFRAIATCRVIARYVTRPFSPLQSRPHRPAESANHDDVASSWSEQQQCDIVVVADDVHQRVGCRIDITRHNSSRQRAGSSWNV
jgi:hypothetical protein